MANQNKKQLKEFSQSIPTPKSILNYKDDDVVAAIQKEVGKEKDFTVLKITHQSNQYYNVVISWIIPDEDWSFELDKYKYIQLLHQYRVDLFTELSKLIPVVNVNLAAFDFVKGGEEIKFAFTILLSDTNNKDWVTGRKKQTMDQRERLKLLQTESKSNKKSKINEIHYEPSKIKEKERHYPFSQYKEDVFDILYQSEGSEYSLEDMEMLMDFYRKIIKNNWYEGKSVEGTANDIKKKFVSKPKKIAYDNSIDENEQINEVSFDPQTLKNREFDYPFDDYKIAVFDAIERNSERLDSITIESIISDYMGKIKQAWYEQEDPESIAIHLLTAYNRNHEDTNLEEDALNEGLYNYNQLDYTFYVCELIDGGIKINEGFESKDDALGRIREQKDEGNTEGLNFKVFSGKFLKQKGIDPNEDSNWGNPSYMMDTMKESKIKESFDDQEGTWINEDTPNIQDVVSFIGDKASASDIYNTLKQKNASPTIKKGNKRWKIDVLKTVLNKLKLSAKTLDQTFKQIPGYEGFSYFGGDSGGLYEDVELDYEFQPANVPGMPTTDEDFMECNSNMKSIPVKECDLVEGKLYSLFESNGLIVETVQYLKKQEGRYLFEKSASGRKIKLLGKEIPLYLKKVMKKKKTDENKKNLKEGWKQRVELSFPDAFKAVEKARTLPGIMGANAIDKNKVVIIFNNRKLNIEKLKQLLQHQTEEIV